MFNLFISRTEFNQIENMNDFVSIVQKNFAKILEIDGSDKEIEILFVEKNLESESLLIYQKEKLSLDLEGKELIIFLLQ